MKTFFVVCSLFVAISAAANTVSHDQFFAEDVFKGGIECGSVSGADAYFNDPVVAYEKPEAASIFKEKKALQGACVSGGGDCECYALFVEKMPAKNKDEAFYKVKMRDGAFVWVLGKTLTEKSIIKLATKAEPGEIQFRTPAPAIALDAEMKKRISVAQLTEIPTEIMRRVREKNTERLVLARIASLETVNGQQLARMEVDLVTNDPEAQDWNEAATAKKSEQKFRLREVYVPLLDSKGRINFWLAPAPGC